MVYLLPFYHPLRLIEEVCMLDQMSGGRLELGIGRGVSPFETAAYGLDFAQTQSMYHEAYQVLLKGITSDELTFEGKFYRFAKVRMMMRPVQRPHPPLWYGVNLPENADWPAENDVNIISLAPPQAVRPIFERYLSARTRLNKDDSTLRGVGRHVVVAETDAQALAIARRTYPQTSSGCSNATARPHVWRTSIQKRSTRLWRSAPPSRVRRRPWQILWPPTLRPLGQITGRPGSPSAT
jgi:alkanesulfonate monooxygenase SsuD/methylene tetrahydromethanopterin reductase-like flavin-dependent oxidoreductase (luciferase family)